MDGIFRNLNRVAEVWLDEYKELYYEIRPHNRRLGAGDVSERMKLKSDLHCKSFKWCGRSSTYIGCVDNSTVQVS